MDNCVVSFLFEGKLSKTRAKFFLPRSETDGFVSLVGLFRLFRFEAKQQVSHAKRKGNIAKHSEKVQQKETKEAKRK
jgi:hypothetical protein